MSTKENYLRWLNSAKVSEQDKEILRKMDQKEIDDAFFKDVEFGTAGMRGVLGPGTNRLNNFTVKKATVAFAKYLLELFPNAKKEGVVISHDNRHMSREFTLLSAETLNDFGIKTYIFDALRPTPELSFAVRYLKACAGIMITASHNPKQYNGYKVYDETGCQLVPDKIKRLLEIIASLPNELEVEYEVAKQRGENILLDNKVDDEYVRLVESIAINKDLDKSNFKVVFTPNHGTSYVNSMRIFKDLGYRIYPVMSQVDPDPDFSGTLSPNPEDARSFIEPIKLAKEIDADLIVMTDPDGDRVGLGYKAKDGSYQTLTGNQSAALLMDYIFSQKKAKGTLSDNGVMYYTIVTSSLGGDIARHYGVKVEEFLTGFKFIGNRIDYYEKLGHGPKFEFGYEESYGCLIGDYARDKDGVAAVMSLCEAAAYYRSKGLTLWDQMINIYEKYGYYKEGQIAIVLEGSDGAKKIKEMMENLRNNLPEKIGKYKVLSFKDVSLDIEKDMVTGETKKTGLPKSNVLYYTLENDAWCCVRPSGTEPKIKLYMGVKTDSFESASEELELLKEAMREIVK